MNIAQIRLESHRLVDTLPNYRMDRKTGGGRRSGGVAMGSAAGSAIGCIK